MPWSYRDGRTRPGIEKALFTFCLAVLFTLPPGNAARADTPPCDIQCFPAQLAICPVSTLRAHVGFPVQYTARHSWQSSGCSQPGSLTWSVVDGPAEFDIDGAGGLFYWTPEQKGVYDVTIKIEVLGQPELSATTTFTALVDDSTMTYPLWRDYLPQVDTVEITGRATGAPDAKFHWYRVEVNEVDAPDVEPDDEQWVTIAGPVYSEVRVDDTLATWDVSGIPDGSRYYVRIVVRLRNGDESHVTNQVILDRTAKPGWPQRVGPITHSPVPADLDDDGRSEILVVTHDGKLHAWNIDGSERFTIEFGGSTYSAPSVGDINGDGRPEVVWSVGSYTGNSRIFACHNDGTIVAGFPIDGPDGRTLRATPTLADLNGDGVDDLIVGARAPGCGCGAQVLAYAYDAYWQTPYPLPGWPQTLPEDHWSMYASASVADVDGDGSLEVFCESTTSAAMSGVTRAFAWHADGTPLAGWEGGVVLPVNIRGSQTNGAGSPCGSAQPALADLDGNGTYEVVVGPNVVSSDGQVLFTLPNATPALSAAIGDIDGVPGNGLEIAVGGRVYTAYGEVVTGGLPTSVPLTSSIIGPMSHGEIAVSASPRAGWIAPGVFSFHRDGTHSDNYPKSMFGNTLDAGAPAVGDFDNDGLTDVLVGVTDASYGGVVSVWRCPHSEQLQDLSHWPMLGHDPAHSGRYRVPAPVRPGPATVTRESNKAIVRWTDLSMNEDNYVVERSMTGEPHTFVPVSYLPPESTMYIAWGAANADAEFRVRAVRIDPTSGELALSAFSLAEEVAPPKFESQVWGVPVD